MTTIENLQDALNWRYAVKEFIKGKQVDAGKLEAILEAGRMAPAAYGLQPYKLIHVVNPEIREKLKAAAYGQSKMTDAGDLFVITVRTDIDDNFVDEYVANISETRGVSVEQLKGFTNNMKVDIVASRDANNKFAWAGRQAYISLGFMLETGALLGVDICPIEGFGVSEFDNVLDLSSQNLRSIGAFVVGERDASDAYATAKKVRISKEDFIKEI